MPEILTESFCERCGTRYTFESSAPRTKRIGRFKVLSKGLKNFVMSDDTSLDEALAAARNDEERQVVAHQLDAFHKTFNFCMTCRQYTCGNCWNDAEGRCLTCAPDLSREALPAAFPDVAAHNGSSDGVHVGAASPIDDLAWPTTDLRREGELVPVVEELSWPEAELGAEDLASRLAALGVGGDEEDRAAAEAVAEPVIEEPEHHIEAVPEPVVEAIAEPIAQAPVEAVAQAPVEAVADPAEAPVAEPIEAVAEPDGVEDRAAAAAQQTADLLSRFRPGQSIDAALDAYEASMVDDAGSAAPIIAAVDQEYVVPAAEPATIAAEPEPVAAEPAPAAAEPEPRPVEAEPLAAALAPEPVAADPEPEPVAADPEPVAAEPQPEPVAATAEPSPAPQPDRDDRVELPAWRIVAPDVPAAADGHPAPEPAAPAATTPAPGYPATPQWPTAPQAEPDNLAFLTARLSKTPGDLWAASSREVLSSPSGPRPGTAAAPAAPAIQACVSCGLSLSATARFCRRCGTRQG